MRDGQFSKPDLTRFENFSNAEEVDGGLDKQFCFREADDMFIGPSWKRWKGSKHILVLGVDPQHYG